MERILNDDVLIRRIPKVQSHFRDETVTSACFKLKPGEDGVSVSVRRLCPSIDDCIIDKSRYLAGFISVKDVLELGCTCVHDPKPDNYSHALIKGVTNTIARKLAMKCRIVSIE